MAVRKVEQAHGARGGAWELAREARRRVRETLTAHGGVLARQKLQAVRGGVRDVVFGRSWLGFARDWLFCRFMSLLSQLDEQNDDIREL